MSYGIYLVVVNNMSGKKTIRERLLHLLSPSRSQGVLELTEQMGEREPSVRTELGHLLKQGKVISVPQEHDKRMRVYRLKEAS